MASNASIKAGHRRKWRKWVKRLAREFTTLDASVAIYERLGDIARGNPSIMSPDDVVVWLSRNYAEALGVGVRRLVDESADSLSLVRLLLDISHHNKSLTRSSYVHWFKGQREHGHEQFDNLVAPGASYIPKAMPQEDIRHAREVTAGIVDVVNRSIAHLNIDGKVHGRRAPAFQEAYDALRELELILLRYRVLLTGKHSDGFLPTWMYDWTSVFREPWIKPEDGEDALAG